MPMWLSSFAGTRQESGSGTASFAGSGCISATPPALDMARADLPAETMLDHFAGALSRSGDIKQASSSLGQSVAWGSARFREICKQLDIPVFALDEVPADPAGWQ